jgi:hypothetical protein
MRNLLFAVKLISAAVLVLTVIVFVPISSQAAEEVIFDQNDLSRAVEIRNLNITGTLYNVTFSGSNTTADAAYGAWPGAFDFNTSDGAENAVLAVNAALNTAGALTVGVAGGTELNFYRVGYKSDTYLSIQAVIFWEGGRSEGDIELEPWFKPGQPDGDGYFFGVRQWAKFTLSSEPPDEVTIGGSVTGLVGSGLVLKNNGTDDETIAGDGEFTFNTPLAIGSTYNVTVALDPSNPGQDCDVANGSGTVPNQAVTNVVVTCAPPDTPAGNEQVIFDQNDSTRAVEIRDLDINGMLYTVTFSETNTTAFQVYGDYPGTFDFDTLDGAEDAVIAVNAALNTAGALTVGVEGSTELSAYRVGFGSATIVDGVQAVAFWEGGRGDGDIELEPWFKPGQPDGDGYFFGVRLWAKFSSANTAFLPAIYLLLLLTPDGS